MSPAARSPGPTSGSPGSPRLLVRAGDPGFTLGDRIVSIDGRSAAGLLPEAVTMFAEAHRPGTTLALGVERRGAVRTIRIVVGAATD
jgi:C-terminal processing protease CtpA/Prc